MNIPLGNLTEAVFGAIAQANAIKWLEQSLLKASAIERVRAEMYATDADAIILVCSDGHRFECIFEKQLEYIRKRNPQGVVSPLAVPGGMLTLCPNLKASMPSDNDVDYMLRSTELLVKRKRPNTFIGYTHVACAFGMHPDECNMTPVQMLLRMPEAKDRIRRNFASLIHTDAYLHFGPEERGGLTWKFKREPFFRWVDANPDCAIEQWPPQRFIDQARNEALSSVATTRLPEVIRP